MARPPQHWDDNRLEQIIGNLLRGGVLTAALVVLLGGILYLVRHGATVPDYHMFRGEPADLRGVAGIVTDALSLTSRGVIQLGLLLLIATPVARVVFSLIAFALEHDRIYVIVTLIVLSVLLYSLTGAGS